MGITVDYYQAIVFITSPTVTVSVQEVYDAVRAAEDTPVGGSFGGPVKSVTDGFVDGEGEADLGDGFATPLTITFDANWYIEFWDGVVLGTVNDGNIAGGKDGRPVRCTVGSSDTALVLGAERGITTASSGAITPGDIDDISDAVWAHANGLDVQGLLQKNQYIDQQVYDVNGHLTSARVRIYSVAGSVGTDNNVTATFTMTATWSGDEMTDYAMVKS